MLMGTYPTRNEPAGSQLGSVQLSLDLPGALRRRLRLHAHSEGRDIGEILTEAIREALERATKSPKNSTSRALRLVGGRSRG